jgi:hypothetical protein
MTAEPVGGYSLAGVRRATTRPQRELIRRASQVLSADDRVIAAWLVGGFAVGIGDAFSDVDLQCSVHDEAAGELRESWTQVASQIAPVVHAEPYRQVIGGTCITPDWLHFDIVFHPRSAVDPAGITGMVPLFDKAGDMPDQPVPRPDRTTAPFFPEAAVNMFLYLLGNMVAVVGRDEVIPGTNGVIVTRDIALVSLLLAERGISSTREHAFGNPFPFTKRLRRYLTDEQNEVLESLPPLRTDWESIIGCYVALARAFLPRARRLADATGAEWPAAYEQATVRYFESMLGADLGLPPYAASASRTEKL